MACVIGPVARVVFAAATGVLAMACSGYVVRHAARYGGRAIAGMGIMIDCRIVEAA